jgi:hypothetical protein
VLATPHCRGVEGLPEGQTGWLAGLRDPHVARALALIHPLARAAMDDSRPAAV